MGSIVGAALKGFGKALRKVKPSKSKWVKDKSGTIVGMKPGTGNVPWHVSAGKTLKRRAEIVKTDRRVKTIDAIASAQKKRKEGTAELKKLRTTGWTKKPYGTRGSKAYYPKDSGKTAHMVGKKKPIKKKIKDEDVPF
jgi:hypothetical protein